MSAAPGSSRPRVAVVAAAAFLAACSGGGPSEGLASDEAPAASTTAVDQEPATTTTTTRPAPTSAPPADVVILAAGDIAWCDGDGDEATAALLDRHPDALVLTLGDHAYPDGSPEEYASCFDASWGRHRDRIRPAPGNHDFHTAGGAGYFGYFGAAAGEAGKGWYRTEVGEWGVVALNSVCSVVGCGPDSEQVTWLQADLAAHADTRCALAFWHHPRFSSGVVHGSNASTDTLWRTVQAAGVDIVLTGHEHQYERFAPLGAEGAPTADGTRAFVVGTGGRSHYRGFADPPLAGSEARHSGTFGVLELTLGSGGYDWRFLAADGTALDAGSGECR